MRKFIKRTLLSLQIFKQHANLFPIKSGVAFSNYSSLCKKQIATLLCTFAYVYSWHTSGICLSPFRNLCNCFTYGYLPLKGSARFIHFGGLLSAVFL